MDDRYLNFNEFLKQRASEIVKFTQALQLDTKKRGYQSVPKSVRRRAMSHNRYRIPVFIRKPMEDDLAKTQSMQKIPKCRKHIRKRQRLFLSYKNRYDKVKWLSTHIWAAKRMRMVKYHGYKIAQTPNEKCFRSSYRHFRHNTCLMDFSYLQILTINFPSLLPKNIKINTTEIRINQLYEGQIYHHQNGQLICPLLILPENQRKIHCFYHPCCKQQIDQLMWDDSMQITNSPSKSQIYFLLGPRAVERAKQGIEKCGVFLKDKIPSFTLEQKNRAFYVGKNEKQVEKKAKISEPHKQQIKTGYDPVQNKRIRKIMLEEMQKKEVLEMEEVKEFWQFFSENQNTRTNQIIFTITNRSKYTHKRRNKISKQEKKILLSEKKKQPQQIKAKSPPKQKIIQIEEKIQPLHNVTIDPFVIATFQKSSLFQGCFIFCSNRDNCKIWRELSKSNVKVIGRQEYRHCLLESGILSFPEDYPETVAFDEYNRNRSMKLIDKYKRLPPQKRPSYEKISSPFPYLFKKQGKQLTKVKIEMVSRGRCFEGSYICKLQKQDFQVIESMLQNGKMKSVFSQEKGKKGENTVSYKTDCYEQINKKLSNLQGKRQVIGFVTSGGFLFHQSREGGLGYTFAPTEDEYILIRKPTSLHYFLATIDLY